MQSMENDETVSHPSHSRLEDADEARVSHIPTTTATRLDKKNKQQLVLHKPPAVPSVESVALAAPHEAIYNNESGVSEAAFRQVWEQSGANCSL